MFVNLHDPIGCRPVNFFLNFKFYDGWLTLTTCGRAKVPRANLGHKVVALVYYTLAALADHRHLLACRARKAVRARLGRAWVLRGAKGEQMREAELPLVARVRRRRPEPPGRVKCAHMKSKWSTSRLALGLKARPGHVGGVGAQPRRGLTLVRYISRNVYFRLSCVAHLDNVVLGRLFDQLKRASRIPCHHLISYIDNISRMAGCLTTSSSVNST